MTNLGRPRTIGLLLPGIALMAILFLWPSVQLLAYSFYRHVPGGGLQPAFVLTNYQRLITDAFYLGVAARTIWLGLQVTAIAIGLGYPVAYWLVSLPPRRRAAVIGLVVLPLMTSVVVRSFGWFIILGETGVLNQVLLKLHVVPRPLRIIYTDTATIIGLVHILLPFMVLSINSVLENRDPALEQAAQNLGASPLRTFLHVTLPMSIPGLATGSLIVFVLTISSFVTPTLLGGPTRKVLAALVYEQGLMLFNWPFSAALAFSILAISVFVLAIYLRVVAAYTR